LGFPGFAGGGEFDITGRLDPFGSALEFVLRRNVPYRTMEPLVVVIGHKLRHDLLRIFQRQRRFHSEATALNRTMISFQFAVALGVIRRGLYMRHPVDPDKFLEILRDKLRTVIRDNPGPGVGEPLPGPLQDAPAAVSGSICMAEKPDTINSCLIQFCKAVKDRYPELKIFLYGSYAKGNHTPA